MGKRQGVGRAVERPVDPQTEIIIRKAEPADLPAIADFNVRMARETEDKALDLPTVRRGVEEVLANPGRGFYLVASRAGRAVGQLMVTSEWSDWRCAEFWWIQSVFVVPEARGQGIYRRLYQNLESLAWRRGACGLRLYVERGNAAAQAVYQALGMGRSHYDLFEIEF